MDELLDLVNEKDEIIGTVWKSEAHKNPKLIHREVAIAVFNDKNEVLLQQRSLNKTNDPGGWKVTAAGHIGHGEQPIDAVKRELKEELGLIVDPSYYKKDFDTYQNKESRFTYLYYVVIKGKPQIILDPAEVMDYAWVKLTELETFAKDNNYNLQGLSHLMIMEIAEKLDLL